MNPTSAGISGGIIPPVPPSSQGSRNEGLAWAEMLSRIGRQNCRLSAVLGEVRPHGRARGAKTVLEELEKERARIARDLHAGAGQPLAGIKMNLELIDGCIGPLPGPARDAVLRLRTLTDQALAQVRAVSHRLHPPAWQELTTAEALRSLIESAGFATQMETVLDFDPLRAEPEHGIKVTLYRCAQEALGNIARHAQATRVEMHLRQLDGAIELEVRDNGRGLEAVAPKGTGIGLVSIREHAAAFGGDAAISSGPGGTSIRVRIPTGGNQNDQG